MTSTMQTNQPVRVAILGFGGLGKGMANLIQYRPDFKLVAVADRQGYKMDAAGLISDEVVVAKTVADIDGFTASEDAIIDLLKTHGDDIDGVFMALPNLPVEFFHDVVKRMSEEAQFKGVFVDALKRTEAVERLLELNDTLRRDGTLYITGCGATPGFLTSIASIAAHSFVEVDQVEIKFGVGVANWEQYKATVREDLIHLEGFDAKRVACMTDEEIESELDERQGIITLTDMEHADDVILEMAGVCSRDRVTVGGLVDTRSAKKPISTQVLVTGKTANGATGTHQFVVSDNATMVDNVCGPALGYMLQGVHLREQKHAGILTSADVMPRFSRQVKTGANGSATKEVVASV